MHDAFYHIMHDVVGTVPRGTGNLPKFNEIAVVFPGDGSEPMRNRDIVVQLREGGEGDLQYISTLHGAYDPLHFVLLFPHRNLGWMLNMHSQG